MTPSLRRIPFRLLSGASDVHLRYLEEDPDLRPFLGTRPHDASTLLQNAPLHARRLVSPKALSDSLVAYAERHGAPNPALENAAAIADPGTCVVITGQQPGLFGGPLYSLHKAATAVRLAREISALPGAPRVVPVFWNHTDDHDIDEANSTCVVNPNLEVQRLRLELPRSGAALRDIPIARQQEQALAAIGDLLPLSDFREWALAPFTPQKPTDTFGSIQARFLFNTLGAAGLVVIEPRDLPDEAFDILPRWCNAADGIRSVIRSTIEHLADAGVDVTMDPTATLMFQMAGNRRTALSDGDNLPRPRALSPGVLLRPTWQDACLPSIASVVGPGELAYLAIAGPLYRHLGVPAPVFVPRASLTMVEPSLKKLLDRFEWDLPNLAQGPTELARNLHAGEENPIERSIEELAEQTQERMDELTKKIRKFDKQMVGPTERTKAKITDELAKLTTRLRKSRQNREGTGVRQIRRLCSHLRPRGRLQERVLCALPFLVAHGEELIENLIDAADPFMLEHGVLEF